MNQYLDAMGFQPEAVTPPTSGAKALEMLRPLTDGGQPAIKLPAAAMDDEELLNSFAAVEKFLPSMGLSVAETPDGGAVVFDPTKFDPKAMRPTAPAGTPAAKNEKAAPVPAPEQSPPPPIGGGNPDAVQGQRQVNEQRAKNLEAPPPSEGQGFLGKMLKRAY